MEKGTRVYVVGWGEGIVDGIEGDHIVIDQGQRRCRVLKDQVVILAKFDLIMKCQELDRSMKEVQGIIADMLRQEQEILGR